MSQEIEFKILPDGTVEIDMTGYKGNACEAELRKITRILGEVVKSKKKQEYYETSKVQITQEE